VTPLPCGLLTGFLFPRPCDNHAIGTCAKCNRTACEEHATLSASGLLCTACQRGSDLPDALSDALDLSGVGPLFHPTDIAAFEAAGGDEPEDDTFADLS
jgi:hypothetical protein